MNAIATKKIERDFLLEAVTYDHLADYLCAEYGHDLAIWPDGFVTTVETSIGFHHDEQPLTRIPCPGIGNLDSAYFAQGFCDDERTDDGEYVENETGRVIGSLADVIRECCRDGDMTEYMDALVTALEQSATE